MTYGRAKEFSIWFAKNCFKFPNSLVFIVQQYVLCRYYLHILQTWEKCIHVQHVVCMVNSISMQYIYIILSILYRWYSEYYLHTWIIQHSDFKGILVNMVELWKLATQNPTVDMVLIFEVIYSRTKWNEVHSSKEYQCHGRKTMLRKIL